MKKNRDVLTVVTGRETFDGAGVKLVRLFSAASEARFDPFLMMDAFDNDRPEDYVKGFPWHPHRGIETITYLIEGQVEHGDSLGNQGTIRDGDCQWMTAGSGIIHQEMPKPPGRMLGVQIWLNLPARDKMAPPAYGDIVAADVPLVEEGSATVRIISGQYGGRSGAFEGRYLKPLFLDVCLGPGSSWVLESEPEHTLYTYVFWGSGCMDPKGTITRPRTATLFGPGDAIEVTSLEEELRFILLSGPALAEPIAWGGPIVMNSAAELEQAYEDLRTGNFIK